MKNLPSFWETWVGSLGWKIPWSREYPLQYSYLENPMDRDAWQATLCGVTKSQTLLNDFRFTYISAAVGKSHQSCPTLCDPIDGSPPGSRPWDSPGKLTGVGCHFQVQCMKLKSESEVAQSCPTLSDPMDCSLPSSSVHGIFQARVLEWVAIAFSAN